MIDVKLRLLERYRICPLRKVPGTCRAVDDVDESALQKQAEPESVACTGDR